LLWLALAWWLLSGHVAPAVPPRVQWWLPVLVGLGPIVRPDFLVFSVGFIVALALLSGRAEALRIVLLAAMVPVVTELVRMAYFVSLVPNTAMAKEASLSNWSQGWRYLVDFVGSYELLVPLALLAALGWAELRRRPSAATKRYALLAAVIAGSGLVHALYVVKVGGDFMHARLLLPAYFVLLLPVSVVVAKGLMRFAAAAVAGWVIFAIFVLRPPYSASAVRPGVAGALEALDPSTGISDERRFYTRKASESHPVTIDDYLRHDPWAKSGVAVRQFATRERDPVLVLQALAEVPTIVPLRRGSAPRTVASAENLGFYAYAAGTGVDVIDDHGLADVVAGRLRLRERGRPGHEKTMPDVWTFARYAAPGARLPEGMTGAQVDAARRALSCGDLRALLERTDGSWSLGDVPSNLLDAVRTFRFRFDDDPLIAEREVCGR
jgi:arabinofuranosyltransferase